MSKLRWPSMIALPLIALAGCSDAGKSGSSDQAKPVARPVAAAGPAARKGESPGMVDFEPTKPGIQLEEILYRPATGAAPFIELANAGADPVPLQPLTLMVDSTPIPLERVAEKLAPGARLLIVLDGPPRADGSTYHAGDKMTISADSGRAAILDNFGNPIDEVAWGHAPGAVNPVAGGVRLEVEPGTSIGRAPGATRLRSSMAWVGYPAREVTPGVVNPPPAVRGLHPMSGARIGRSDASLSWFPVPGATGYRLQVAADESFAKVILDQSTTQPLIDVSGLPAGRYAWRVQSRFAGDRTAAYSSASVIALADDSSVSRISGQLLEILGVAPAQAQAAQTSAGSLCPQPTTPLAQEPCWILPVPLISQHKDTRMLLIEHDVPSGAPHPWDDDHGQLRADDKADNGNCGLASLAMMNRFAGGDLSQDRIGYEIFKTRTQGPEHDLMYGQGLADPEVRRAFEFALGVAPVVKARGNLENFWGNMKAQVESGTPMLVQNNTHIFVVIGYYIRNGERIVVANDPGTFRRVEFPLNDQAAQAAVLDLYQYLAQDRIVPRMQEASVTQDSDGDEVVDFDETERFHTQPNNNDTDSDGVRDKQDIYASVFDAQYGYARFRTGRDEDHDGRAMELDSDSDAGSCKDGDEDLNGNGIYESAVVSRPESWNFKFLDDSCQGLAGHLTYRVHSSVTVVPDMQWGQVNSWTGINVRLKPVPDQPGFYEDDGSTYQYAGSQYSLTIVPNCRMIGRSWANSSGDFTGGNAGIVSGQINDDGRLALHITTGIPSENVQGWADICGLTGSGSGSSHSADFRDECWGDPVQPGQPGYVAGHKIFHFNCHDPEWDATGTVTVP